MAVNTANQQENALSSSKRHSAWRRTFPRSASRMFLRMSSAASRLSTRPWRA